jgi:hypothetical protein
MSPTVAFDLWDRGYSTWPIPASGAALALVSYILIKLRAGSPVWRSLTTQKVVDYLSGVGMLGALVATVFLVTTLGDYIHLRNAYRSGRYDIVAGCLTSYRSAHPGGHGDEVLNIQGREFSYSSSEITNAFHKPNVDGGPVAADSWIRLFSVGPQIVHLETASHACPAA